MSSPFCKLGSPLGSSFRLSAMAAKIACGLPNKAEPEKKKEIPD
jgi:hypothetical protein